MRVCLRLRGRVCPVRAPRMHIACLLIAHARLDVRVGGGRVRVCAEGVFWECVCACVLLVRLSLSLCRAGWGGAASQVSAGAAVVEVVSVPAQPPEPPVAAPRKASDAGASPGATPRPLPTPEMCVTDRCGCCAFA